MCKQTVIGLKPKNKIVYDKNSIIPKALYKAMAVSGRLAQELIAKKRSSIISYALERKRLNVGLVLITILKENLQNR